MSYLLDRFHIFYNTRGFLNQETPLLSRPQTFAVLKRSLTPRWPLTPHLVRSHVWFYPRIIASKSHENTSKYVDTVTFFQKTWIKGHWPLDDLWPTCVEVTCVTLPKDHCFQVPWEYINGCVYSDQFCKIPHTTYGHRGKLGNGEQLSLEAYKYQENNIYILIIM